MHLFEAMIALFDATHDPQFQQRAGELFALFVSNLYDAPAQASMPIRHRGRFSKNASNWLRRS
jgi:hypothetical protein